MGVAVSGEIFGRNLSAGHMLTSSSVALLT